MSKLTKLDNLFTKVNLDPESRYFLIKLFSELNDNQINETTELFYKKPELINFFINNVKNKKDALEENDKDRWNKIIENEVEYLSNLRI